MALVIGRAGEHGRRAHRVTLAWDAGEIVLEPHGNERVRVQISIGSDREELDLDLGGNGVRAIQTESKLIKIEEIGKSGARAAVNEQSKLIKIEDTGASLPEVTIVL